MDRAPRMSENFNGAPSPPYWNGASPQAYRGQVQPDIVEHEIHRPVEKDRSLSPALSNDTTDMGSPGLENAWGLSADKEVYHRPPAQPADPPSPPAAEKRRICGLSRKAFWILLALLLLALIGLGAGLGAGLGTRKHGSSGPAAAASTTVAPNPSANPSPVPTGDPDYSMGGALNPAYYSTEGAFNGSGIALASQSFEGDEHGRMVIYFQHHTGSIRWQQLTTDGKWLGGSPSEVVAYDAKNGTPLSAVAYAMNETSSWHIFYIDKDNYIRQKSGNNHTSLWSNGTVNSLNLKAMDADSVGMQACWYGSFYGDADYAHSPSTNDGSGASSYGSEVGMHLWYASDSNTFQQYGWRDGDTDWAHQYTWTDMDGHAGVGCYSWGPGTVTYTVMVNRDHAVEVWWKDTNSSLSSNSSHPINSWSKSYNISWHAEQTRIVEEDTLTVQVQGGPVGLPGTHLSVSTIPDRSGGDSLIVFFQQEGDDITMYTRDMEGGQWTFVPLPIPDT
ncbi:hypothetical protein H2199_005560 [Coniosporium tulheliwenetii]|uniref:Uncharacterized protein n=1 Tax=Coniosporium tulheliwenetii TaxID=3383036 RepID=A0ACC2YZN8_9PEZI|nr:hypothetical protein H2199_005560 [Cladosporium sp. JES 115]